MQGQEPSAIFANHRAQFFRALYVNGWLAARFRVLHSRFVSSFISALCLFAGGSGGHIFPATRDIDASAYRFFLSFSRRFYLPSRYKPVHACVATGLRARASAMTLLFSVLT